MNFTQEQRYEIIEKIIKEGKRMEEILKMSLEILMKAEKKRSLPNPESMILSLVDKVMTQKNMNIK